MFCTKGWMPKNKKEITIHQGSYIQKILEHFGMANSDTVMTPIDHATWLTPMTDNNVFEHPTLYQEAIGALLYTSLGTTPDITFVVQALSQFSVNPSKAHWQAVKQILWYLQGTKDLGITYNDLNGHADIHVTGYSNADWALSPVDRRSISGYVFLIGGRAVAWSSKKQPTVALSSTEAEYMASSNATTQAIWLWNLFTELNFIQPSPTELLLDNQSAITLASNPQFHARSKHIDICHHFIRSCITDGHVELFWCPTGDMITDVLTKPLPYPSFSILHQALGMLAPV